MTECRQPFQLETVILSHGPFSLDKKHLICLQFFKYIEEMEWAIEVCKASGLPVMATMCISAEGDYKNVSIQECAVRMAKAGADVGKRGRCR